MYVFNSNSCSIPDLHRLYVIRAILVFAARNDSSTNKSYISIGASILLEHTL